MKELLKKIIFDQQEWNLKGTLKRVIDENLISTPEILVITGIRRCGKSVLLQQIRERQDEKDYYMNFDDERLIQFKVDDFQTLYETFIELFGEQKTFYFDEIQNIIGWERFVRRLYDAGNKVFITGSNANMLSKELGTHLTGRYLEIELYPFSFGEYLQMKDAFPTQKEMYSTIGRSNLLRHFNDYLITGGFPRYVEYQNDRYLSTLYENIIYKDVITRNKLNNEKELLELVYYLASNATKRFSYTSLANAIGIKHAETVKNYINYIENTFLLGQLMKFDYSLKVQMSNQKKIYFVDNAIIRKIGFNATDNHGQMLENAVYVELKRRGLDIYYHADKVECDFVVRQGTYISAAYQVTRSMSNEKTKEREINGLLSALKTYNLPEGIILTQEEENQLEIEEKTIKIIPVWKWMLQS